MLIAYALQIKGIELIRAEPSHVEYLVACKYAPCSRNFVISADLAPQLHSAGNPLGYLDPVGRRDQFC